MHHPTDIIADTTAFVTPVVEHWLEREIAQWVRSMKDRSDDPSHHERTLLPRSYISLPPVGRLPLSQDSLDRMNLVRYRAIPIILPSGKNTLGIMVFKVSVGHTHLLTRQFIS